MIKPYQSIEIQAEGFKALAQIVSSPKKGDDFYTIKMYKEYAKIPKEVFEKAQARGLK